VFLQFYPLLAEAAHLTTAEAVSGSPANVAAVHAAAIAAPVAPVTAALALTGLDPVMLVDGREEMGKPEIVATNGAHRYQFVSEPNRARFGAEPARFSIQNSTCLVVSGAAVDPKLFAVHDKRIYAFASSDCINQFRSRPADFVPSHK
jgi:YHS domain-containing protein